MKTKKNPEYVKLIREIHKLNEERIKAEGEAHSKRLLIDRYKEDSRAALKELIVANSKDIEVVLTETQRGYLSFKCRIPMNEGLEPLVKAFLGCPPFSIIVSSFTIHIDGNRKYVNVDVKVEKTQVLLRFSLHCQDQDDVVPILKQLGASKPIIFAGREPSLEQEDVEAWSRQLR